VETSTVETSTVEASSVEATSVKAASMEARTRGGSCRGKRNHGSCNYRDNNFPGHEGTPDRLSSPRLPKQHNRYLFPTAANPSPRRGPRGPSLRLPDALGAPGLLFGSRTWADASSCFEMTAAQLQPAARARYAVLSRIPHRERTGLGGC
jgi:hypothetical protein